MSSSWRGLDLPQVSLNICLPVLDVQSGWCVASIDISDEVELLSWPPIQLTLEKNVDCLVKGHLPKFSEYQVCGLRLD